MIAALIPFARITASQFHPISLAPRLARPKTRTTSPAQAKQGPRYTMSRKPSPVALTAATLMAHAVYVHGLGAIDSVDVARAASDLHRLAKATNRQAEAECNGEYYDGQRRGLALHGLTKDLDTLIVKTGGRLDRRIAKLNQSLAELSVMAYRNGDPRGYTLRLRSIVDNRPLPRNGMEFEVWGIG